MFLTHSKTGWKSDSCLCRTRVIKCHYLALVCPFDRVLGSAIEVGVASAYSFDQSLLGAAGHAISMATKILIKCENCGDKNLERTETEEGHAWVCARFKVSHDAAAPLSFLRVHAAQESFYR